MNRKTNVAGNAGAASSGERISRRDQLLMVALDLFSRRDFSTVTIKDIGNEAGINTGLIYYYFKNKEHLFRESLEFAVQQSLDKYRELQAAHDHPVQLVHQWFANNIVLSEPIRKLVKIMLDYNSIPNRDFSISDLIDRFYREEEQAILASSIRQGISMGLFKAVDADKTASFVSVHLDGIMVASLVRNEFDIATSVHDLENFLWRHLGYRPDPTAGTAER